MNPKTTYDSDSTVINKSKITNGGDNEAVSVISANPVTTKYSQYSY